MPLPRRLPLLGSLLLGLICAYAFAAILTQDASGSAAPRCLGKRATIVSAARTIVGGKAPDVIVVEGAGRHAVSGLGGNDRICGGSGNDAIDAGRGIDRVIAGGGDDDLAGFKGPDQLDGGPGNDRIDGEQGSDSVVGGAGDDELIGDKGNDTIDGGEGDDLVTGGPGDDGPLQGGSGADQVLGEAGSDEADGGPGDGDVVRGDAGEDRLAGGAGSLDIVSYASATRRGVEVDLGANAAKGDGHDVLAGFEDAVGSPQDDLLTGDGGGNRLDGGLGNDTLLNGGGGGTAFGGPGSDVCTGFALIDSCGPEKAPPADAAAVVLNQGLDGVSLIVQGGPDADALRVSQAADGSLTVSSAGRTFAGDGCSSQGAGGGAVISCPGGQAVSLIVVTGGAGDDELAIDPSVSPRVSARLDGNAGSDKLTGGEGDDVLEGGENFKDPDNGTDQLAGNGGSDVLLADPGADQLQGGSGNDLLVSSQAICQKHVFDGGPGSDTVSYARSNAPMRVRLGGTGSSPGCSQPDRLLPGNESLEGSDGADVLIGDGGANSLLGRDGADTLISGGGKDFLDARDGARDRRIDCGGGADIALTDESDPRPVGC